MRGGLDATLRTRVGDVEALRSKLQGEDGFNAAKISSAFGEGAANRLQAAVDRERTYAATQREVTRNSATAKRQAAGKLLDETRTGSLDLKSSTLTGLGAPGRQAHGRRARDAGADGEQQRAPGSGDRNGTRGPRVEPGSDPLIPGPRRGAARPGWRTCRTAWRRRPVGAIAGTAPGARRELDVSPGKIARSALAAYLPQDRAAVAGMDDRR